jgi:ribonuclease P protein component
MSYEENVSTASAKSQVYPRVSGSNGNQRRTERYQRASRQRPETPGRLVSKAEFDQVFNAGNKIVGRFFVAYRRPAHFFKAGFITSKKVGNSVARHRARRLLKEAWRLQRGAMVNPCEIVFIARSALLRVKCGDVENEIRKYLF